MTTATTDTGRPDRQFEMSEDEIDAVLRRCGHGTLSLARDGEAYAVPMSFGFDGDRLYFVFRRPAERSRKLEFVEETERASFLVSDVDSKDDWGSVLVEGRLEAVGGGDWDALLEAVEGNAWFPSLFSETDPMQDFLGYALTPEFVSGRRGTAYSV